MDLRLATAAALLGSAAVCGLAANRAERADMPEGQRRGAATYMSGFSALATQVLWMRVERARLAHRDDQSLLYLRAIHDLEPQLVSAARYFAWEIGVNLAEGNADPNVRWTLTLEGLRALDTAIAENPLDPDAWANRAAFVVLRIAQSEELTGYYKKHVRAGGPVSDAQGDFAKAIELDPLDIESRFALAVTATREGKEAVVAGQFDAAQRAFARAVEAYDGLFATLGADDIDPNSAMGREIADLRSSRADVKALADETTERATTPK